MGINTFTTQEALNFDSYNEWNYEELDLGTALAGYDSSTYITAADPAKKVVIYPIPGQTVAANDNLYIYLNDTISTASQSAEGDTMDASETALTIDDGSNVSAGDVLLVDAELMYVSAVADDDGDDGYTPSTLTVTRGYGTSIAATHADNTLVWKVGTPSNHTTTTSVNPIMKLGVDQLPFTMSGVIITGFNAWNTGAENNANDDISVLSFH
jgi:hypothetical protein